MADFKAKVCPELNASARYLVAVYEATPGSTGPGCCPAALAAVLDALGECFRESAGELSTVNPEVAGNVICGYAAMLRGEQP